MSLQYGISHKKYHTRLVTFDMLAWEIIYTILSFVQEKIWSFVKLNILQFGQNSERNLSMFITFVDVQVCQGVVNIGQVWKV